MTFDAAGKVVSVAVTEPRFSRADVAVLLASRREDHAPRGSHGHKISESTDPAHQYVWSVEPPIVDFAAVALSKARKEYADAMKQAGIDYDEATLLWSTTRNDD